VRLPVVVALVAFVGLVAVAPASARENASHPRVARNDKRIGLIAPGTFRNLRVCGATAFSRAQHRCTTDQRASSITSNRISCSVDIVVRRTAVVRGRISYRGGLAHEIGPTVLKPGVYPAWVFENIKVDQPLPGGSWRCEFSVGSARTSLTFASGGPVGDIVNVAVCSRDGTVRHESSKLTLCRRDDSAALLPAGEPVFCSATFAGVTGKIALLEILRGGVRKSSTDFVVGSTIWLGTVLLRPYATATLQPGEFVCRFSLDGQVVAERPFLVTR
jgi:hypothetical protein